MDREQRPYASDMLIFAMLTGRVVSYSFVILKNIILSLFSQWAVKSILTEQDELKHNPRYWLNPDSMLNKFVLWDLYPNIQEFTIKFRIFGLGKG